MNPFSQWIHSRLPAITSSIASATERERFFIFKIVPTIMYPRIYGTPVNEGGREQGNHRNTNTIVLNMRTSAIKAVVTMDCNMLCLIL